MRAFDRVRAAVLYFGKKGERDMAYLMQYVFYAIPVAAILFFAVSLYRYRKAKNANKKNPDTFSESEMKMRKILLAVSSLIAGTLAAVVIGFAVLLYMAVAFM